MHYLFQCGSSDIFALATDKTGASIPRLEASAPWLLRRELSFARMRLHFPEAVDTIQQRGFCLLPSTYVKLAA
jgi:hypothetical protein